jgi:alpha-L-arabinofuranosidase
MLSFRRIAVAFTVTAALFQATATVAAGPIRITVQPAGKDTISRHIYGHFSEHLGRCIYGGYYVGDKNTTVANTRGMRNDVVQALRRLHIPNLRWPGGCFADTYHWKDGVGPKENRPTIVNTWWGGVTEDNSFGTHEFLDLCEQLGAEPYISGNVGSGTVQELADWIQYVNFGGVGPMASLRRKNGHDAPWSARYWGIGNETWGCGGNMTAEYYASIYRLYTTFASSWGKSPIFRVASGAGGGDYHWTEVLMRDVPLGLLDGVGLHHYAARWGNMGSATKFGDDEYYDTMKRAWQMEDLVNGHAAIMDRYDAQKKVALVVDEWGGWYAVEPGTNPGFLYQQNTMRDAVLAGMTLNVFNNRCDRVRMANLAQTVNVLQAVILTDSVRMLLTPTYHVMEMYVPHHDAVLLPVSLDSPMIYAGPDTMKALSVSASRDRGGVTHVSLVNVDLHTAHDVHLQMGDGVKKVSGRILRSAKVQEHNTFEKPEMVKPVEFNGAKIEGGVVKLTLPACSVVMLTITN